MEKVTLAVLDASLAAQYAAAYRRNAAHLHLEPDEAQVTDATMAERLDDPADRNVKFAVVLDGAVVGRVDLNPVAPPKYTIGYWIDHCVAGRGYGRAAVRLAIEHARRALGATDVYAGVTHGNEASVRLLRGVGFLKVADMGDYERFHKPLDGGQPRNPDDDTPSPTERE